MHTKTILVKLFSGLAVSFVALASIDSFAITIEIDGAGATNEASAVSTSCSLFGKQSFTSTGGMTVFTDEQAASGNIGLRMTAPGGSTGFGQFGGVIDFPDCVDDSSFRLVRGDELWIRTRVFVPANWEWNSGRNKFLRFRTYYDQNGSRQSAGYNDLYIDGQTGRSDYQPFMFIYEGEQRWFGFGERSDFFQPNVWKTIELYMKLDHLKRSEGGDAVVRVWIDGRLAGETFDRRTLSRADAYIDSFNFFTYFGDERSPKDQSVYVDDLVITDQTPSNVDTAGNRFIGMGGFQPEVPPRPPIAR
ncbi:MAG: hypothetical protein AAF098_16190 [Pseudomonadota bacterium]